MIDDSTYGFERKIAQDLKDSVQFKEEATGSNPAVASSAGILAIAPSGGLDGRTGTGPWTLGSATCAKITVSGDTATEGTNTVTVYNLSTVAIPEGEIFCAYRIGSKYFADYIPPTVQLQVSGLNFQISYDAGGSYSTWATGEECA